AAVRRVVAGDLDRAGQDDAEPRADLAHVREPLAGRKRARLAEAPHALDLHRIEPGKHLLAARVADRRRPLAPHGPPRPYPPAPRTTAVAPRKRTDKSAGSRRQVRSCPRPSWPAGAGSIPGGTVAAATIEVGDALIASDPQPGPHFDHAGGREAARISCARETRADGACQDQTDAYGHDCLAHCRGPCLIGALGKNGWRVAGRSLPQASSISVAVGVGGVVTLLHEALAALPAALVGARGGIGEEAERRSGEHERSDENFRGLGKHGHLLRLRCREDPTMLAAIPRSAGAGDHDGVARRDICSRTRERRVIGKGGM